MRPVYPPLHLRCMHRHRQQAGSYRFYGVFKGPFHDLGPDIALPYECSTTCLFNAESTKAFANSMRCTTPSTTLRLVPLRFSTDS